MPGRGFSGQKIGCIQSTRAKTVTLTLMGEEALFKDKGVDTDIFSKRDSAPFLRTEGKIP